VEEQKKKEEKIIYIMKKGKMFLILLMILLSATVLNARDIDSLKFYNIKNTIISEISKLDSCGLPYHLSMPSPKWDSIGNYTEIIQKVSVFHPVIVPLVLNNPRDVLNKVLLEILTDSSSGFKLAWSANIILYSINDEDGNSLFKYGDYGGDKCLKWFKEEKNYYIAFWDKKLDR
jgi:hypothetical protein